MKFTELVIGIICFLAFISFVTNCTGNNTETIKKFLKKIGMTGEVKENLGGFSRKDNCTPRNSSHNV